MNRPGIHVVFSVAVLLGLFLHPLSAEEKNQNKPLSNADIIEMSRAGVPQSTIIAAIQSTPVKFDTSPAGLIDLHAAGVSEAVLNQMVNAGSRAKYQASFGVATGTFPVKEAAGKTVRYSAWIKTENVQNGYAGIWWRVDGQEKGQVLAFDNSEARMIDNAPAGASGVMRGAVGTTPWTKYEFELPVSASAKNINFGVLFTGTGTAWFDSLSIELDDMPYTNPPAFDLDFESSTAKGFYTGGNGYRVGIDSTTSYTGHQSLKMAFTGDGGDSKTAPRQ